MVDLNILDAFGSSRERIRELFTAQPPSDAENLTEDQRKLRMEEVERRKWWEQRDSGRFEEALRFNLSNAKIYQAADLAWEPPPISKDTIPLMLYAQGKIEVEQCEAALKACQCADKFVRKDEKGKVTGIDLPKFHEVSINFVRSIISRRWSAQSNKYANLWPYYAYEARSTGQVGKLRADVMSQVSDIMADQFGYRQHEGQLMRNMLLYGWAMDFVQGSWFVEKQWRLKPGSDTSALPAGEGGEKPKPTPEAVVVKEGVRRTTAHPTRVWWDNSQPLSGINSDTGPQWLLYWDVTRYREIVDNPEYFNRKNVSYSNRLWDIQSAHPQYFTHYMDTIKPPVGLSSATVNDRAANVGNYTADRGDEGVFKAILYDKIIPKDHGLGDYPYPVWMVRHVVSDGVTIYGEFLPSGPAAYWGFNQRDDRLVNLGMAHEIIPFQDMASNLATDMLLTVQLELLRVVSLNTDLLSTEQISLVRKQMQGRNFSTEPIVLEVSFKRHEQLSLNIKDVISIAETKAGQSLTAIFQSLVQLISIMERLMALSPAEQGQPAPREVSATEVTEIAGTTSSVYDAISNAIDEGRAAMKRIIAESTIVCKVGDVQVPVIKRYSRKVIGLAGFEVNDMEEEDFSDPQIKRQTVMGSARSLDHAYIFTTRDGSERPSSTNAANTLVQLLNAFAAYPPLIQGLGKEKLYTMANEILRLSGASADLVLELDEGEDNSMGQDQLDPIKQILEQLSQELKAISQQVAQQEQVNADQQKAIELIGQLAQEVKRINLKTQDQKPERLVTYRDCPEDVKRQMEASEGWKPSREKTLAAQELQMEKSQPNTNQN